MHILSLADIRHKRRAARKKAAEPKGALIGMRKTSENAYLRQCRKGRLKFWTRLYLYHRGRHDARKNVVRADEHGVYSSPYIYQEIQAYRLALQTEKARLCDSTTSARTGISVLQLQIQQSAAALTRQNPLPTDYEKNSAEQTIAILETRKQELSSYINAEDELESLRSEQLSSVLRTKIAAYWNGVLHGCGDRLQIPPIIAIDHLIH